MFPSTVTVTCPEDITKLPWAGTWEDDGPICALVSQYILNEPTLAKRQLAEELLNWHMCGEKVTIVGTNYDPRDYPWG